VKEKDVDGTGFALFYSWLTVAGWNGSSLQTKKKEVGGDKVANSKGKKTSTEAIGVTIVSLIGEEHLLSLI